MTYEISSGDYHLRGRKCFEIAEKSADQQYYFYCAWEFRNAIERFPFELLVLSYTAFQRISKNKLKKYQPDKIFISLKQIEPDYESLWVFINLLLSVHYPEDFPKTLDRDKLTDVYGKLNSYLHALKNPADTIEITLWWASFRTVLMEADSLLTYLTYPAFGTIHLNERGRDQYHRWNEGEIDDSALISEFRDDMQLEK
ncbi:MAG: hypothetical protein IIA58_03350 [Candidatus Marinimicrobia bacterium]|nr:hypothetical protein [Candidatus Neomarinimicrobiota bacterium]